MLVLKKLKGKLSGRKVVFSDRTWQVYHGRLALAKGGGTQTQTPVPTGPWQQQIPFINLLFNEAAGLYGGGPPQYYPGQTVLGPNQLIQDTQNAAVGQVNQNVPTNQAVMGTAANTAVNAASNPVAQIGGNLAPQLQGSIGSLLAGAPGTVQGVGAQIQPAISGAINRAAGQAPTQISTPGVNYGGIDLQGQLNQSLQGGAMSPYLDQIVQGALRSSNQNFQRNVLPGIGDEASAANQVGGTRQGVAQGIAAGDLTTAQNDMIGRIYQGAFDQGAQERQNAMSLIAQGQQANLGAALDTARINEAIRSGMMGEALQGANIGANILGQGQQGQLQAGQLGANLLTQGQQIGLDQLVRGGSLLPLLQGANMQQLGFANEMGMQQYGFNQAQRDADVERWFFEQFAPYNALTQYQNYISGPYGSTVGNTGSNALPPGFSPYYGGQPQQPSPGGPPPMQIPTPINPGGGYNPFQPGGNPWWMNQLQPVQQYGA